METGYDYIVDGDGTGDFLTIGEAVKAAEDSGIRPVSIYIKKGIYREHLEISCPYLTLEGESAKETVITGSLFAKMVMEDGLRRGTFRSYTVLIDTHDFTARNLTFENSAGRGELVGQAPALYVDGDRICFDHCRILASQDTLFTGPLPPKEIEENGFVGPKQYAPRINGRHYYKDCFIRGDIDFIFGSATAYFENCDLFSQEIGREVNGYVTAASTPEEQKYGYVFEHCHFVGNCPPNSVYLGRPWRNFARVVLLNCRLEEHIRREGWHDWGKRESHDTLYFAEYNSTGPGAVMDSRPEWVDILTGAKAMDYGREKVLGGEDGWMAADKDIE